MLLYTSCDTSSHFSANQGIFRIILKVSATQGEAVNIHGRCQPNVNTEAFQLCSHNITTFLANHPTPALRQCRADGNGSAILLVNCSVPLRFLFSKAQEFQHRLRKQFRHFGKGTIIQRINAVLIHAILRAQAQSGRTIRHNKSRNSISCKQSGCFACGTGNGNTRIANDTVAVCCSVKGAGTEQRQICTAHCCGNFHCFWIDCRLCRDNLTNSGC